MTLPPLSQALREALEREFPEADVADVIELIVPLLEHREQQIRQEWERQIQEVTLQLSKCERDLSKASARLSKGKAPAIGGTSIDAVATTGGKATVSTKL